MAVFAVAAATGLRLAFEPLLGSNAPYIIFFAAVVVVRHLAGRGPALAATGMGLICAWYFFLEPRFSFVVEDPGAIVSLGLFAGICVGISLLEPRDRRRSGRIARAWLEEEFAAPVEKSTMRRIAMLAGSALALGILASLLWTGFKRSTEAERLVEHTYQVLDAAGSVRSHLERAQTAQRGYLLTGDQYYSDVYQAAIASERAAAATLRLLTADNHGQQVLLDEFDRQWRSRLDMVANGIEVRRQQGMAAAAELAHANRGKERGDRLRAILDAVDDEERRLLHISTMAASAADSRTRWTLGVGTGSLVLLLILAGAAIERQIQERHQVEKVLARQARLIDLSRDAVITADGNRVITGWNSGALEMYGWTEEQALGKTAHELLHTTASIPTAEMDGILAREGRWEGELTHTRSDGRQIAVEGRQVLQRDEAGRPIGCLEINRDISDRKAAEAALREGQEEFRMLANAIPQLCWMANADGWITWYNDRWYEYTGTTAEQMQGWGWQSVHNPEALPEVMQRWSDSLATGERFDMVFPLRGRDGVFRPFLTRVMPVRDQGGRVVRWFGTNTDISEQQRTEDEIRRLNAELGQRVRERTAELEAANKELEAFAYSVSHDLRAPLRGIDGWTLALIEDFCGQCEKLNGKGRGYLDRVRSETQRIGHLIDDLLQLSRITRAEMHRDAVDLSRIAETVAARLREAHPQRRLEFAIRPGLKAFGDTRLLDVALTNLLENAVKFTAPRTPGRIAFESVESEGKPAFVVRDNGVGFDMAYAGTLFGAFQRLHSESEFPGTGIGLATVQRVIHRHGGRIWAEAEPDRGASFYFTIAEQK